VPLWNARKSQLFLPVSQKTKRDEYQGCSHVETVPQRINDKMYEQAKGMTGCYTDKCRDRKRIVRGMA
jgi:hypothetical protein